MDGPGAHGRLGEHRVAAREEVGESDGDDLAVLGRGLLHVGKEDRKDLRKQSTSHCISTSLPFPRGQGLTQAAVGSCRASQSLHPDRVPPSRSPRRSR